MVYLDDSIMQKGKTASAGSRCLEGFAAPFDATVVARLGCDTESVILGEFGIEAPAGPLKAPMLANDVFGFVRVEAAKQGLCYIRPTYGTVSRYGLIPTAASMDQIGVLCADAESGFAILSRIAGSDERDGAMFPELSYSYPKKEGPLRFASLSGEYAKGLNPLSVTLPYTEVWEQVLTILAYSELSNNISRYDGVKFGRHASVYSSLGELYANSRTEGFGLPAKLAAVMGCTLLSEGYYEAYYLQAMKIRRLIKQSLCFDEYDILALPAGSPLAVLAGLPSVICGGVELVADVRNEGALRAAWEVAAS